MDGYGFLHACHWWSFTLKNGSKYFSSHSEMNVNVYKKRFFAFIIVVIVAVKKKKQHNEEINYYIYFVTSGYN